MRLKNLYDDSGLRVVVLDRENPAQIKNVLISNTHEAKCLYYSI